MTIFLDVDDKHWILPRDRRELVDALLARIDSDDDDHLLRLAVACLECEKKGILTKRN
ncbi:hypothetical protein [Corynebacterium glutamicum]|uniref:hypothetical protein n=1 Tax=Corynebacterium glutamicum TaxID=1718 RepID=UPI001B8B7736|nr:hypothetical protein [Corynebacterium glutamicum]